MLSSKFLTSAMRKPRCRVTVTSWTRKIPALPAAGAARHNLSSTEGRAKKTGTNNLVSWIPLCQHYVSLASAVRPAAYVRCLGTRGLPSSVSFSEIMARYIDIGDDKGVAYFHVYA